MSENITLFSGYNFLENRNTNYCLLVLKSLYEENPKYLGEVLQYLLGDDLGEVVGEVVGVKFRQQEKKKSAVPDGLIAQSAFTIYIETKNSDRFDDRQLAAHLEELDAEPSGLKILIALGNFDTSDEDRFESIKKLCAEKYHKTLRFALLSFKELLEACEQLKDLPKNLADMLADFRQYLTEMNLLSTWERLLDVVNCAHWADEVIANNAYKCPASGGAYRHARSRFFGLYRNKAVARVALIEAVVDLESAEKAKLLWKNVRDREGKEFIEIARTKHDKISKGEYPWRVFVLGPLEETAFHKRTKGGMFGTKKYFDVGALQASDAKDLAAKLRDRDWPENTWVVEATTSRDNP
jgi:hypothetical protein